MDRGERELISLAGANATAKYLKQVGRRRTMYADGGNIPQIDEVSH
jgi:hypothetical protein